MRKYQSYNPSGVEWIGEKPQHWISTKLKYVSTIITGNTPSKNNEDNYTNGEFLWIKPDGLNEFKPTNDCKEKISEIGLSETRIVPPYSVLINGIGNIGKFGYSELPVSTNQQIHSIVFNPKKVDKRYGLFLISSLKDEMNRNSEKVVVSIYTKSKLERLEFILPPLQEQEQIVKYLDEKTSIIDKLISTKERKIELLKEQRTSLINQVITKGLNPNVKMKDSGVEWIGEIPEGWNFIRLGVLGNFSKGKGITKDKIKENGFPCIRNGEIYTTYNLRFSEPKSFIDEITITESIKVNKGTLFFTGDGETLEEIGKCVVYLGEEEIYVGGGINVFTPKTDKVSPIYLSYVMSSTSCVYQKSIGGKGEIVVHIYSKQLRDIQFGLPKLEEQQEIVEYLDKHTKEIDDLVSMEQKKIELLKEYRQSLISEVITGKIKVVE
jgi:type I restriction enzyme S subunit